MVTNSIRVQDLFSLEKRFLVPLFQRPYVWTQTEQWEPLWQDVCSIAERLCDGRDVRPHFLGAVVLDQMRTMTGEIEARLIIDGQQRLTTLQVLLAAARDVLGGLNLAKPAEMLRRLTVNDDPAPDDREQRLKVWPTNVDRDQFAIVMDPDPSYSPEDKIRQATAVAPGERRLAECYRFFAEAVSGWVNESGEGERETRVRMLLEALRSRLYLVVIDLGEEDEAQVIFETLNARGTPLLPIDLVKNHLFHEAARQKMNLEKLYAKYWQSFDEQSGFWRKNVGRGHAQRPRIDLFLQHYLAMMSEDEIGASHIFASYKEFWAREIPGQGPEERMRQLHDYAQIFRGFEESASTTPRGRFLYRVRAMDMTTVYPLLLHLCARTDVAEASLEPIWQDIESFLVRRLVCRLSTRGYNRLFLDLITIARRSDAPASVIRQWLLDQTAEANRWPTDEEFERGWLSLRAFQDLLRARLRMILEALEAQLRTDFSEDVVLRSTLQVEHLMPQAWEEHWPLPAATDGAEGRDRRQELIHRFGNLTLLTQKLNPAVSNSAWSRKHEEIQKHSALALNRQLLHETIWDEERIEERTRNLFKVALRVWPRPEPGSSATTSPR